MSAGIPEDKVLQLVEQAQKWTEETAPQTLDEFPLLPEGLNLLFSTATDKDLNISEDANGCIWYTTISDSFANLGFEDLNYQASKITGTNSAASYNAYPIGDNPYTIRLDKEISKSDLFRVGCYYIENTELNQHTWYKDISVFYDFYDDIISSIDVSYSLIVFSSPVLQVDWGISSQFGDYPYCVYGIYMNVDGKYICLRYDYETNMLLDFEQR